MKLGSSKLVPPPTHSTQAADALRGHHHVFVLHAPLGSGLGDVVLGPEGAEVERLAAPEPEVEDGVRGRGVVGVLAAVPDHRHPPAQKHSITWINSRGLPANVFPAVPVRYWVLSFPRSSPPSWPLPAAPRAQ